MQELSLVWSAGLFLSFWLLLSPDALLHIYFKLTVAQIPEASLLVPSYLLLSCTWESIVHPEEESGVPPRQILLKTAVFLSAKVYSDATVGDNGARSTRPYLVKG